MGLLDNLVMKIGGKDPNGKVKGVSVGENGEVDVKLTGRIVGEDKIKIGEEFYPVRWEKDSEGNAVMAIARVDENGYDSIEDEYKFRQTNKDTFLPFIIAENITVPPSTEVSNLTVVQDLPMRGKAFGIGIRLNKSANFRVRFLPRASVTATALGSQFVVFETGNAVDRVTKQINLLTPEDGIMVAPAYHIEFRNNDEEPFIIDRLIGWHIL